MRRFVFLIAAGIVLLLPHTLAAQQDQKWVVSLSLIHISEPTRPY